MIVLYQHILITKKSRKRIVALKSKFKNKKTKYKNTKLIGYDS